MAELLKQKKRKAGYKAVATKLMNKIQDALSHEELSQEIKTETQAMVKVLREKDSIKRNSIYEYSI